MSAPGCRSKGTGQGGGFIPFNLLGTSIQRYIMKLRFLPSLISLIHFRYQDIPRKLDVQPTDPEFEGRVMTGVS